MADRINSPGTPDVLAPEPHRPIEGDWTDDDGQALDQYFEPNPQGPNLIGTETVIRDQPTYADVAPVVSRLITRSLVIGQAAGTDRAIVPIDPVQVFPADPNRKFLRLRLGLKPDHSYALSNPAAGANLSLTFLSPVERFQSLQAFLTTDATVATRTVELAVDQQSGIMYRVAPSQAQSASTGFQYSYTKTGASAVSGGTYSVLPLDMGGIPTNGKLRTVISSVQVGDALTLLRVTENTHLWRVAGERSDCFGASDLAQDVVWESDCHTGPVWVYAPFSVGPCDLVAESVTQ